MLEMFHQQITKDSKITRKSFKFLKEFSFKIHKVEIYRSE